MEKVLTVTKKETPLHHGTRVEYTISGTDLQSVTYARESERTEVLQEILKRLDQGYQLDVSFSLESLYLSIVNAGLTSVEAWSDFQVEDPPNVSGQEVKEFRDQTNMSAHMLGDILGCTALNITGYEKGKTWGNISWLRMRILQLIMADPKIIIAAGVAKPKMRFSSADRQPRNIYYERKEKLKAERGKIFRKKTIKKR